MILGILSKCGPLHILQVQQEDALALAAAIEVGNDHPIASAIVDRAQMLLAPETMFGGSGKGHTPKAGVSTPGSPVTSGKHARQLDWVWPALDADVVHGAPLKLCATCQLCRRLTTACQPLLPCRGVDAGTGMVISSGCCCPQGFGSTLNLLRL